MQAKNTPMLRGNIPKTKSHIFNFPGDVKSFEQPAFSLKLSAHNSAAQQMLLAALEFDRELCTCSPDIMGSL
jgi:hypothetical protein